MKRLTKRQEQILVLYGQIKPIKEIADELGVSINTVKSHVGRVKDKLGIRNRVQAYRRATRLGLI